MNAKTSVVLSRLQKTVVDVECWTDDGRVLHALADAIGNARSPSGLRQVAIEVRSVFNSQPVFLNAVPVCTSGSFPNSYPDI